MGVVLDAAFSLLSQNADWSTVLAGAEDVLSDSHLQSSTLAMLRAQLQVLVAVIILLAQHWHRWCMGPCPRTTQNSLVIHLWTSTYSKYTISPTKVFNNTLKRRKFWTGWFAKLHSHNVQATDTSITQFYLFLNQWRTEPLVTLLHNFIRSFSSNQNSPTI